MSKLNKSRVQELIQAYGANPKRWPQQERQAGQAWLEENPIDTGILLTDAHSLEQALNTIHSPSGDISLLQARILKLATKTAQDSASYENAGYETAPRVIAAWKTVAAVLVLSTGMGFGIGQVAAADTSYTDAETLFSVSMQSEYSETDLYGEGL